VFCYVARSTAIVGLHPKTYFSLSTLTGNTEYGTFTTLVVRGGDGFGEKLFSTIAAVRDYNINSTMKKSAFAKDGSRFLYRDAWRDPRIVNLRAYAAGSVHKRFPQLATD